MTDRYRCILRLKTDPRNFKGLLAKVLDDIPYKPDSVDCFYNEFEKPPNRKISFERVFLVENLSTQEMKGITSMSIYDQNYRPERPTPFIRLNFRAAEKNDSSLTIEWIHFDNLDFLLRDDKVIYSYISEDVCLSFCNVENQLDTHEQSVKEETWFRNNWGKSIIHRGIHFQAAPIMYFEKCYAPTISTNKLLEFGTKISNDIIKVELGDLYSDPASYRSNQKRFWKTMRLNEVIDDFRSKTQIDFSEFLKRRSELSKEK